MSRYVNTEEGVAVIDRLWEAQKRQILEVAEEFKRLEGKSQAREEEYLNHMKARGYPKTVIRKIAGADRPDTLERRLAAYRDKIGLTA